MSMNIVVSSLLLVLIIIQLFDTVISFTVLRSSSSSIKQQQQQQYTTTSTVLYGEKKKVFIDGEAGTTGIQVRDRLATRDDLILLSAPTELRKDDATRKKLINEADAVILCKFICFFIKLDKKTNDNRFQYFFTNIFFLSPSKIGIFFYRFTR
jgi:hypothetical protein